MIVAWPTWLLCSASAILKALTIVSVGPFELPLRGMLETILTVPVRVEATERARAGTGTLGTLTAVAEPGAFCP